MQENKKRLIVYVGDQPKTFTTDDVLISAANLVPSVMAEVTELLLIDSTESPLPPRFATMANRFAGEAGATFTHIWQLSLSDFIALQVGEKVMVVSASHPDHHLEVMGTVHSFPNVDVHVQIDSFIFKGPQQHDFSVGDVIQVSRREIYLLALSEVDVA